MEVRNNRLAGALIGGIALAGATLAVPGDARAQTEQTILAIPSVSVLFLVQYLAEDLHLWEKQGLDVKAVNIAGVGSINAVVSNSADFSMATGPTITRAYAHGQKLVALANVLDQSGEDVVVRKDITEAARFDPNAPLSMRAEILKGRTMAIQSIGSIPDVVLRVVARSAGVTPEQMVITPMQAPEFLGAFARHAIDGFSGPPPSIQQVVLDGTGMILSDSAKGEPTEYSPLAAGLLLTRADFCAAHRSICEKTVQGIVEAARILRNQPSETLAIMKTRFGTYDEKVLTAAYDMVKAMTPDSSVTTPKELENGDLMNIAAGFMKPEEKLADYGALIDNAFVK